MFEENSYFQEEKIKNFLNNLEKSRINKENKNQKNSNYELRNRMNNNLNKRKIAERLIIEPNLEQYKLTTYVT